MIDESECRLLHARRDAFDFVVAVHILEELGLLQEVWHIIFPFFLAFLCCSGAIFCLLVALDGCLCVITLIIFNLTLPALLIGSGILVALLLSRLIIEFIFVFHDHAVGLVKEPLPNAEGIDVGAREQRGNN